MVAQFYVRPPEDGRNASANLLPPPPNTPHPENLSLQAR